MNELNITVEQRSKAFSYDVVFGEYDVEGVGDWVKNLIDSKKIALISNRTVFDLYGETVETSLRNEGIEVFVWLMDDGEKYKDFESLNKLLSFLSKNRFGRTDGVVSLGGGVCGDLAGFASAIYLRGLPFLQIPTTLLAMIDASVGGKTAINTAFGKNLIGSFNQPAGVFVDVAVLQTLDPREIAAGFAEAVKHAAISGQELMRETKDFIDRYPISGLSKYFDQDDVIASLRKLVSSHIRFKAEIVMNDELEAPERVDPRSRKILNFGHTAGHAIEKATSYEVFRHGEAIAYGMLVAAKISKKLEILDKGSLKLLNDVIASLGSLPDASHLDIREVVNALSFDKKRDQNSSYWILLKGIGEPVIVRDNEIPRSVIEQTLKEILHS